MHTYNTPNYGQQNETPYSETEFGYENESFEGEDENLFEYEADNEYENDEEANYESMFSEISLQELAGEMPVGENEEELDHFIHRLLRRSVGHRRLSTDAQLERRLRKLLKGLVRKLFGSNNGAHRFTHSTGENSLQSEVFGNENEFEVRKRFIRMAANAGRRAFQMGKQNNRDARIRLALKNAAQKHFPALLRMKKYHSNGVQFAARMDRLENALMQLAEKIAAIYPNDGGGQSAASQGKSESPGQNDSQEENNPEYENLYNEDYEDNEFESEDGEFEDNEYEENESGENEYEENEYEAGAQSGSCGCAQCRKGSANQTENEDNEENEYEENEYEENEESEFGETEYEENEYEENEYESAHNLESTFNETVQMELASELLAVQSEDELDQFLGKLLKKAARAVKKVAKSAIPGPLGGFLKKIAKQALPIAGGVLGGSFVPGVGNIIGKKLGSSAANLFELELEGLSAEDREYENAKAFVRFAGNAIKRSTLLRRNHPPIHRAKTAVRHAARRYAPGLLRRGRMNRQRPNKFHRRPFHHPRSQWKKTHHSKYPQGKMQPRSYAQQRTYAQNPNLGGDENGNQFQNYPDSSGNDANALSQKMDRFEKIIQQLNEKISSLNPDNNPQNDNGNAGHHLDSAGSGNENGSDNEYWN